jgi:hypothetical protein
MNRTLRWHVVLLTVLAASPALANTQFRAARMTRNDVPFGKGQCDIRLQVDDQVEVSVRRDVVAIRTLSGQEARDDGSECNEPLPDREMDGFNFEVKDSRNDIRLLEEPNRRNRFTAFVRIRDNSGGFGRYHFRITWALTGGSYNGRPGDYRPGGGRPDFGRPDENGRGGFAWHNANHFSGNGRGSSSLTGYGSQRLFDANVDIDRGGRIQVSFRTDSGRPITFAGNVIARDGDALKADVVADDRMLRLRGPMYISVDGRQNIYRISLDATNGRDNLRLNWDRR